jgi:hypothetical protein
VYSKLQAFSAASQLIFGLNSWDEPQTQSNAKLDSWPVGRNETHE